MNLAADLANRRPTSAAGLVLHSPATPQDLDDTLDTLDRGERIVDAADGNERAHQVNAMLAASTSHPRLTDHADSGWHVHYRDDDHSVGRLLSALFAMGTALHLAGRGMHRLQRCAVTECTTIFADTSRTGRQRYCSLRCANRDAVRRHRARTSSAAAR
ncbi:CGNR zinc finger domain-containing protein [Streptomyces sp. 900105755]